MRNILRRPRARVVVATALAGGLVLGAAAAAHADFTSRPASAPSVAPAPSVKAATSADTATAATAASCFSTYLSYGSRGTCVRLLQTNLGGLSVDGVYGAGTRSRVRSFQDDAGLTVDGKVGPQTWRKLRTYGKAIGWVHGVTLYMCEKSSTRFQYSMWNNSGRLAWWRLFMTNTYLDSYAIRDDRIAIQGTMPAQSRVTERFWAFHSSEQKWSTTNVRDFSRSTLPACA